MRYLSYVIISFVYSYFIKPQIYSCLWLTKIHRNQSLTISWANCMRMVTVLIKTSQQPLDITSKESLHILIHLLENQQILAMLRVTQNAGISSTLVEVADVEIRQKLSNAIWKQLNWMMQRPWTTSEWCLNQAMMKNSQTLIKLSNTIQRLTNLEVQMPRLTLLFITLT